MFDANSEIAARLCAKSLRSSGLSRLYANGTQAAMTTNNAGMIRLARRS
jgi:hypothetical protein